MKRWKRSLFRTETCVWPQRAETSVGSVGSWWVSKRAGWVRGGSDQPVKMEGNWLVHSVVLFSAVAVIGSERGWNGRVADGMAVWRKARAWTKSS